MPNWFDVLQFFQTQIEGSDIALFGLSHVTEDLGISLDVAINAVWKSAQIYKFRDSWFIEYPTQYCRVTRLVEREHYPFIESAVLSLLQYQIER